MSVNDNKTSSNEKLNLLEIRNLNTMHSNTIQAPPHCQVERQSKQPTSPPATDIQPIIPRSQHRAQRKHAHRKQRRHQKANKSTNTQLAQEKIDMEIEQASNLLDEHLKQFETALALTQTATTPPEKLDEYQEDDNFVPLGANRDATLAFKAGIQNGTIPSMIVDSGTTSTISTEEDKEACIATNQKSNKTFAVANGNVEHATEQRLLQHELRNPARTVDVVPGITTASLLSTSKMADAKYITIFDEEEVNIYDATNTKITVSRGAILKGWRMKDTKLWRIPLTKYVNNLNTDTCIVNQPPSELLKNRPPPTDAINNVYELTSTATLIRYLHAAAGFPTKATWLKAIANNHYTSWPGLTLTAVRKHFPESVETVKGHMKKQKAGIRSTKKQLIMPTETDEELPQATTTKSREIMLQVLDTTDELAMKIYTDQTGKFPTRSSKGNQYIMVLAELDSNAILVEPMRNRTAGEMVKTYNNLIRRLKKCGITPKHQILDNEISAEYKEAMAEHNITYQLVPPHDHRRNMAERAIQTFKAHFISILCGVDENFPLHLWCRLLPQAEITLNMLRSSTITPNISAHAHLHGQHDYNAHPLAPLGCAVEMHVQPDIRQTFAPHSVSGYNVGTSFEHYRCYTIWCKDTNSVRTGNTIFFKHKYLTMPTLTRADSLLMAAKDMATTLLGGVATTNDTAEALSQLMNIFKTNAEKEKELEMAAQPQRVRERIKKAQLDRVQREHDQAMARVEIATPMGTSENDNTNANDPPALISQEDDDSYSDMENDIDDMPSRNTRSHHRTLTQDIVLMTMDVSSNAKKITARQAASRTYPKDFILEFAGAVLDGTTGNLLEYRHLIKDPRYKEIWGQAFADEIGRLAQGRKGGVEGTNTLFFINKHEVPPDRRGDVTYDRICCNVRPEKDNPHRVRLTMGGNLINYPGDVGTPTADLLTVKLLFNSIVSTPGAKFMSIDISNFYLNTPMERYEYMKMKIEHFPEEIIEEYNLREKVTPDGYLYVEVRAGMYGLPQAGILAQELLEKRLNAKGYRQSTLTPGFWTHDWRPISFTLVVDDFGVKYVGEEHAQHLLNAIQEDYKCKAEWDGSRYLGLTLDWDYENHEVHLSMPGYVHEAMKRFQHELPKRLQHSPHQHVAPNYGAKIQYAPEADESRPLTKQEKKIVQQVIGTFLYYGRAVDSTMLVALSAIASEQANPTWNTMLKTKRFMDYAASHPDAILTYRRSNMILGIHSDASYLSEPQARSRAGGHFFLSDNTAIPPSNNGAVHSIAKIIKSVMSSAAEAELGALYINAREALPMRVTLWEMGHEQPPTPIQTDNTTALGVVTNNIQPRRMKAMDMRYHWLRDREAKSQFRWYWRRGTTNKGDYWTKHFCGSHHTTMRAEILTPVRVLRALRARLNKAMPVFSSSERVC